MLCYVITLLNSVFLPFLDEEEEEEAANDPATATRVDRLVGKAVALAVNDASTNFLFFGASSYLVDLVDLLVGCLVDLLLG